MRTFAIIMETIIEPYTNSYKQQVLDLIVPIQQEEFNIPITAADQPDPGCLSTMAG
jgi:hypothetical protein